MLNKLKLSYIICSLFTIINCNTLHYRTISYDKIKKYNWFTDQYTSYNSNKEIINSLKQKDWSKIKIEIFYGDWCGDSKRELPRFIKIIDEVNIIEICKFINLNRKKKSITNIEKEKNILYVPTIIVYYNDIEKGRIVENAELSIEEDLLKIIEKNRLTFKQKN